MSNQSLKQASIRAVTGTTWDYNGDWIALFDARGIPAGTFNERLLGYINDKLLTAYTDLPQAMQELAEEQGFNNWDSMGTFTP